MKYTLGFVLCQLVASACGFHMFSLNKIPYLEDIENLLDDVQVPTDSEKVLSPVILIPGDGGSRIDAKLNKPTHVHFYCSRHTELFYDTWLNKELLIPGVIDCLVDNLRLVYNNETRKTTNSPGVTLRFPGFGYSETVEWIDTSHASVSAYYVNVANALVAKGYKRGFSLFGAVYDYRKTPNENIEFPARLQGLVETAYKLSNNTPVTLIVHSMGGPMTLNFLHSQPQEWKDKHIKRLISLAGAWAGTVKSLKVYAVGDNLDSTFVTSSAIRALEITTPSLAWLMPSPLFWKPNEVLVTTRNRNYTMNDIQDTLEDLDCAEGWEMYKDALPLMRNFDPPGVEVHCFYGSGPDTIERLDYENRYDLSGTPKHVNGAGDGTINLRSLEACKHWIGQQKQPVYVAEYPNNDHMGILANVTVLKAITNIQLADLL